MQRLRSQQEHVVCYGATAAYAAAREAAADSKHLTRLMA